MRTIITICLTFLSLSLLGQTTDSLGVDDNPTLNRYESQSLNLKFKDNRGTFDFANKKIAFVTGSGGGSYMSKMQFFRELRRDTSGVSGFGQSVFVLTTEEKLGSNGYEAIVTSWVKVLTNKRRAEIIKELKRR